MRKWMLACAIVSVAGFWAESAPAQEVIAAPTPVVAAPAPMVQRTGLFGRLRARRQPTVISQPVVNQPMAVPASTTTGAKIPAQSPIQQAQATTQGPARVQESNYPPQGGVQQAQATMPAASTTMPETIMPMQVAQPRQGLFARMRARRGY